LLATANVVPSTPIIVIVIVEEVRSSETSVLTRATRRNITKDGILHSHRRETLKSYIALTGLALYRRRNVFPVRYELGVYIPEDGILHTHRRENLKPYNCCYYLVIIHPLITSSKSKPAILILLVIL
jgi:hypothetical protein